MIKKRSSSNKAQGRERFETRAAKVNAAGNVAGGLVDLIEWSRNTYYNYKYEDELKYGSASIHALANAKVLVSSATDSKSFPTLLKNHNAFLSDLTNYLTDGTMPSPLDMGGDYATLVGEWGKLLWNNKNTILTREFNFSTESVKRVVITLNQSDEIRKILLVPSINPNKDLKRALDLLTKFQEGLPEKRATIKK